MDVVKVYPLDAVYDSPEDVPEDVMFLFICIYLLNLQHGFMFKILFSILGKIEQKICWIIKLDC